MNPEEWLPFLVSKAPELWDKTLEHLVLVGTAMGLAILLGVTLGIGITRFRRAQNGVLGLAGVLQTIPSLAMLAFLLAITGKIGKPTAITALTLYALLPIVRNTFTGIMGVSDEILEAAEGMGFTRSQRLWMVEMPIAVPIIIAGIRTATVICVGIATLSTFIGAGGLGDFINRGLAMENLSLILLGAVAAAVMALFLDFALGLAEEFLQAGRKPRSLWIKSSIFAGLFVLFAAGLFWLGRGGAREQSAPAREDAVEVHIGTKDFTEQFILGQMMALLLEADERLTVRKTFNLGGTIICHQALAAGEIDIYPEYTGTGLIAVLNAAPEDAGESVFGYVKQQYKQRFDCVWLEPFGFENAYGIAVRREKAAAEGWKTISDLRASASDLRAGFTPEFIERSDGYRALRETYNFAFGDVRDMGPQLMYQALANDQVDVISAFTTDGRIKAYDLQVLVDDRSFLPPYEAAPVVRREVLEQAPHVRRVIEALSGRLDNATMRRLNYEVDEKKREPWAVAREFLRAEGLIEGGEPATGDR